MTHRAKSLTWRLTDLTNGFVRLFILSLLCLPLFLSSAQAQNAPSAPPAAPKLTQTQAQQLLDVLNDPQKRQDFVTTLTNLTAAQKSAPQQTLSLVDQAVNSLSQLGNNIFQEMKIVPKTIKNFASIAPWLDNVSHSPELKAEIFHISLRAAVMILLALAIAALFKIITKKPRAHLIARAQKHENVAILHIKETLKEELHSEEISVSDHSATEAEEAELHNVRAHMHNQSALSRLLLILKRLPYILGYFTLDLIGIALFPLAAILLQALDQHANANCLHAIWSVTWFGCVGYGLWHAILAVLFSPKHSCLRLTSLHNNTAKLFYKWFSRIGIVIAWSFTALIILHDFTLPQNVNLALAKLIALIVHIMIAIMILNGRSFVQRACHRFGETHQSLSTLLKIFASSWWIAAIFFDCALWLVWAANIENGYHLILHLFVRSCIALLIIRILSIVLYGLVERGFRNINDAHFTQEAQVRILRYLPVIQKILGIFLGLLTIYALAIAWGAPITNLLAHNSLGSQVLSSSITIAIALLIGIALWEGINIGIEYHIRQLETSGEKDSASRAARIRTLQPMFRIILLAILTVVIGLTILSQLGVNTAPLLASASIFGVALGFGSQKLVQDFISGIFLLFENALTVGDAVTLNGTYGIVEKLSLRTVHVRANDGSMNIFPFSSLGQIINYNRDFARAIILADVSYDTDTDKAVQALYDITAEMRADPVFGPMIIDNLNIWGVDSLNDSSVTIKGTLPTTTAGRWPVQRQFNRRMKKTFQARDIGLPFPTRTVEISGLEKIISPQK